MYRPNCKSFANEVSGREIGYTYKLVSERAALACVSVRVCVGVVGWCVGGIWRIAILRARSVLIGFNNRRATTAQVHTDFNKTPPLTCHRNSTFFFSPHRIHLNELGSTAPTSSPYLGHRDHKLFNFITYVKITVKITRC